MTKALGLDQASRSGFCVGATDLPFKDWVFGNFRTPNNDEVGVRLLGVYDNVRRLLDKHRPNLLAYEQAFDPTYDAIDALKKGKEPRANYNRTTLTFLQQIAGAVAMAAARAGVPTETYPPRSWYSTLKLPEAPKIFLAKDGMTLLEGNDLVRARQKWRKRTVFQRALAFGAPVQTEDEGDAFGICLHALHGKPASERAQLDLLESTGL